MDARLDLSDEEEEDETRPGPSKRAKAGAGTYQTKFKDEWTKTWPFIQEVKKDACKFLCTIYIRQSAVAICRCRTTYWQRNA